MRLIQAVSLGTPALPSEEDQIVERGGEAGEELLGEPGATGPDMGIAQGVTMTIVATLPIAQ